MFNGVMPKQVQLPLDLTISETEKANLATVWSNFTIDFSASEVIVYYNNTQKLFNSSEFVENLNEAGYSTFFRTYLPTFPSTMSPYLAMWASSAIDYQSIIGKDKMYATNFRWFNQATGSVARDSFSAPGTWSG